MAVQVDRYIKFHGINVVMLLEQTCEGKFRLSSLFTTLIRIAENYEAGHWSWLRISSFFDWSIASGTLL